MLRGIKVEIPSLSPALLILNTNWLLTDYSCNSIFNPRVIHVYFQLGPRIIFEFSVTISLIPAVGSPA